ncbi:hypothetical protein HPP92_022448 [Vanilla planifolia]|uniref:Uncharacterized protein n=1 Tax=Vanilla planifolia TaxID=51239 RepID=A0A835PS12_VANPL|nr:hypothetical protein HPP92_022448 [Vanilla planifolia]
MASRTPFSSLSQVDADLALARALQEQVRDFGGAVSLELEDFMVMALIFWLFTNSRRKGAFMMLDVNRVDDSDYVSSDGGSYEEEDDQEPRAG